MINQSYYDEVLGTRAERQTLKAKNAATAALFEVARDKRGIDAELRVIFFRTLRELGEWEPFKARLKLARDPDAQRQEYLDTCERFGIEAAGIDMAIESPIEQQAKRPRIPKRKFLTSATKVSQK